MSKKLIQAAAGAAGEAVYVEDVFSTYLLKSTSLGVSETVSNGVNLLDEGGLVWSKARDGAGSNVLVDTERGASNCLFSDGTGAEVNINTITTAFYTDGFESGSWINSGGTAQKYASWSFRKQAGFFDVVTWSGDGTSGRTVSHNLGSVPGLVIIKSTNDTTNWKVWHRDLGNNWLELNTTSAVSAETYFPSPPTATELTLSDNGNVNGYASPSKTYVAYLFAHDDQSFGDNQNESIIKCGSFTSGTIQDIDLGWEPQWLLVKAAGTAGAWGIFDVMRGMPTDDVNTAYLLANSSDAEATAGDQPTPIANGFRWNYTGASGFDYIYIAIRRPMKTPTAGTEVFSPVIWTGDGSNDRRIDTNIVSDMVWWKSRSNGTDWVSASMLAGKERALLPNATNSESSVSGYYITDYDNEGFNFGTSDSLYNTNTWTYVTHAFKRATGFFDVVAYTGDGVDGRTINHNLGAVPELMIVKIRAGGSYDWWVYSQPTGTGSMLRLNLADAKIGFSLFYNTAPTSSVFSISSSGATNASGSTYIAYLFATLAGVSKVGSYSGTGSNVDVDCGFSAGARFILIKRTDSTGDWYVYDNERGIVAGNDPYLLLNSTAVEVTSTDYIDPLSSGFTVTSSAPAALNASGGSYIFLAIA